MRLATRTKRLFSSQKFFLGLLFLLLLLLATLISTYQANQKQRLNEKAQAKQKQTIIKKVTEPTGIPQKDREKLHLKNRFSYSLKKYTPLIKTSEVRSSFEKEYGQGSQIKWDKNDKVARQIIMGDNPPTVIVDEKNIEEVTKSFILKNQKIFNNLNSNHLKLEQIHRSQKILTAVFSQKYQNIPVYGGFFNLTASNNKIILIDNYYFYNINTSTKPTKTEDEVIKTAKEFLEIKSEEPSKTTLMIYPELTEDTTTYYLSYKVDLPLIKEPLSQYSVFVDAQTGEVLDYFDNIIYENLSGNVTGKIFPKYPGESQIGVPFKNNEVRLNTSPSSTSTNTSLNGNYSFTNLSPGTYTLESNLSGPWVDVLNGDQPRTVHQSQVTVSDTQSTHNWNWVNNDSSDRQEESNVFYHVNIAHDFFTKGDPFNINPPNYNPGVNYKLPVWVEVGDNYCGAYFAYFPSIGFGNCSEYGNYALSSGIVYHEYAHFVKSVVISIPFPYEGQTGNLNEGWSDYFACSLNDDPCFYRGLTTVYCYRNCQNTKKITDFTSGCNGEPHECAEVVSGSLWDLRQTLSPEVVDNLTISAEKLQPVDFADFLTKVVIADIQLYPSSSHKSQICQAFKNHGIPGEGLPAYICQPFLPYGEITQPEEGEQLFQTTDIKATLCPSESAQTVNYTLELGEGQNPSSWTQIVTGGPITGCQVGVALASFDTDLYYASNYAFKLTTVDNLGKTNITLRHFFLNSFESPQRVDTEGDVGYFTSLALDSNNQPHISYYDGTNGDLKYAYHDETSWKIERVDTEGEVGYFTSLALDSNNQPHISYADRTDGDLKYAYLDETSWKIQPVDTEGHVDFSYSTSLALDSNNQPHIGYVDLYGKDLKYAYHDGTSWKIERVDTEGEADDSISLALDSNNQPHISYYDFVNGDLKYAFYNGTSWKIQPVDTDRYNVLSTSLALDSKNQPHISYADYIFYADHTDGVLRYAFHGGTSWEIQRVDTEGGVGLYASLALDSKNQPHISYADLTNGDLKYAFYRPSCFPENSACGGNIPCCGGLECREGQCLPIFTLPDLTVTDFHLTQTPNMKNPLYASVTYKNIGTAVSPMFTHRFTLNGDVVYEYSFVGLNPGEERTIGLNDRLPNRDKWKPKAGSNILTAEVDYTNSISESNENNNSLSIKFTAE